MNIFQIVLEQPIFNLLIALYNVLPGADLGFAILTLTLLIRLALWPFNNTMLASQRSMQQLQPKIKDLQEKFKDDKEALSKAMLALYAEEKVNPLSSCLPLIAQLLVLIGLNTALRAVIAGNAMSLLYSFVPHPSVVHDTFLGFIDLVKPNIALAVIAAVFQFFQTKMLMQTRPPTSVRAKTGAKDEDMMAAMNKSMLYTMPVVTGVMGLSLPGGVTLYWVAVTLISIVQQFILFRKKPIPATTVVVEKITEGEKKS